MRIYFVNREKKNEMKVGFWKRDDNTNNQPSGSTDSNSFILETRSLVLPTPYVLYWIIVSCLSPFTISRLYSREYNLWQYPFAIRGS